MPGPLDGVRVVEIASGGGLPLAAMLLADMGAEVIRVERAGSTRRELGPAALRGRRSITLDLRQPAGRSVVHRLAVASSAFIEGLRPGLAEALGIGPDACCAANPALVYGRLSGWGQAGPRAQRAGHDLNFLAASGVVDGPSLAATSADRALTTVADRGAPALLFAFGVVCALFEAIHSGCGQVVDCASVDASLVMAAKFGTTAAPAARPPHHLRAPYYGVYATADGQHMAVAAVEPRLYRALLDGLELDADALPSQHDDAAWPHVRSLVAAAFAAHDAAYWAAVFGERDAGVTSVLSSVDARHDPQLQARASFTRVGGQWQPSPAPVLSRTPGSIACPSPVARADFRAVLALAGYTSDDVDELIRSGVVAHLRPK